MSFFKKVNEREVKKKSEFDSNSNQSKENITNQNIKLYQFFEELRVAKEYRHQKDEILKGIAQDLEEFFERYLYDIILDDEIIIDKNRQKDYINYFDYLKYEFIELSKKPWLYNKKRVVVAGRYSAGKSTLINRILEENLLSTDVLPTTAIPTYISDMNWMSDKAVIETKVSFGTKEMKTSHIKDLLIKEELEKFPIHLSDIIDYIAIHRHKLKDVILIDTPGFDPSDKKNMDRDKELMLNQFRDASLILWVIDIEDGDIERNALDVLKSIDSNKLVIILNKADKKPPKEREKIIKQIAKTLSKVNQNPNAIVLVGEGVEEGFDTLKEFLIVKLNKQNIYSEIKNFINELKDNLLRDYLNIGNNSKTTEDNNQFKNFLDNNLVESNNIFSEAKLFLEDVKKDLINKERGALNLKSNYEHIMDILDIVYNENELEKLDDIITLIGDTSLKELYKEAKEILMESLDYLNHFFINNFHYEVPFFDSNRYYIKESDYKEVQNKLYNNINNWQHGWYLLGIAENKIRNIINILDSDLSKIDNNISKINRAINKIYKLQQNFNQI